MAGKASGCWMVLAEKPGRAGLGQTGRSAASGTPEPWAWTRPPPPHPRLLPDPLRRDLSLEGGQLKGQCQGPTIHPPAHESASTRPGLWREPSSRHAVNRPIHLAPPCGLQARQGEALREAPGHRAAKSRVPWGALVEREQPQSRSGGAGGARNRV